MNGLTAKEANHVQREALGKPHVYELIDAAAQRGEGFIFYDSYLPPGLVEELRYDGYSVMNQSTMDRFYYVIRWGS